jgi:predicted DsbA family dithiol-disulfide isomerase
MSRVPPTRSRPAERTHRVLVFTTPSCPWCVRAKQYLRHRAAAVAA